MDRHDLIVGEKYQTVASGVCEILSIESGLVYYETEQGYIRNTELEYVLKNWKRAKICAEIDGGCA